MFSYFNNLSTFRVLFWFLFAVSAGVYFSLPPTPPPDADPALRQATVNALLEGADSFSGYVSAQEALAVSLAAQFEMLDEARDDEVRLNGILERTLEAAPDYVVGIGFSLAGRGSSANRLAFRSRTPTAPTGGPHPSASGGEYSGRPSAREINMERRVKWTMQLSPQNEEASELHALVYVSINCPGDGEPCGDVVVTSSVDWLRAILAEMRQPGSRHPRCVSPDNDVLWLDDNHVLRHARDAQSTSGEVVARSGDADDEFLEADIMSSGWRLMVDNPAWHPKRLHAPPSLPLLGLIVAAGALLLEGMHSALRGGRERGSASLRRQRRKEPASAKEGLVAGIRRLLFQYRITNPDQARIESELRVARQIQFSLLPLAFPVYSEWREFDLHAVLRPAKEVAGDYYDFFMPTTDRLVVAVGDVSGKGVPAALYMAVCRTAFRALAERAATPGELLGNLNDMLVRDNNSGLYVTLACLFIDLSAGKCEYSIAGHPAPLIHKAESDGVEYIDSPRGTIIGMKAGVDYPTGELRLRRGDSLLLYTDGVSEARNDDGDELEYEGLRLRFAKAAGEARCQTIIEALDAALRNFTGNGEQTDDVTMLALRYWGPGGQIVAKRADEGRGGAGRGADGVSLRPS